MLDEPKCETEWRKDVHDVRWGGDGWEWRGDEPFGVANLQLGELEPVSGEGATGDSTVA